MPKQPPPSPPPAGDVPRYPFCTPSYIACLDDGQWVQDELKPTTTGTWRAEKFARDSNVLICDHDHGKGTVRHCNDQQIDALLKESKRPQLRVIILQPTIHEQVGSLDKVDAQTRSNAYDNELGEAGVRETFVTEETRDRLDISHAALIKILAAYDFAPAACSHIRGQEQIFGSRMTRDGTKIVGFEIWYAIRARLFYLRDNLDADLKMTMCYKYDVGTGTAVMLFKYRSFNELPYRLRLELVQKVKDFVMEETTRAVAENPVAPVLSHFTAAVQWYRRAARDPRDTVRREEEKIHAPGQLQHGKEVDKVVKDLHLTMRSLDMDSLQLSFMLDVIYRLRRQHDVFYSVIRRQENRSERDWLYFRVDDELNRLENHITYMRSLTEDVCKRAQRLLDLLFNLSTQKNVRWSERMGHQVMSENAALKAIAIVSMLFLPGTFVCGILGTNVFSMPDGGGDDLVISRYWWILPLTIFGSTLFTVIVFIAWKTRTKSKFEGYLRGDEETGGPLKRARPLVPLSPKAWLDVVGWRVPTKGE